MLLLALPAHALDLPWECATITEPADALAYRDARHAETDGVEDAGQRAMSLAEAWLDTTCLTDCSGGAGTCFTGTTCAGATVDWSYEVIDGSSGTTSEYTYITTITVEPPSEAWTRLTVEETRFSAVYSSTSGLQRTTWVVDWAGDLDPDWPTDGAFTAETRSGRGTSQIEQVGWDDGTCAWETWDTSETSFVSVDGVDTSVYVDFYCTPWRWYGTFEGSFYGFLTYDTWEILDEGDGDGATVEDGDCDDTDPDVHPCATEIAYDGIDQDCADGDLVDVDGDGSDYPADCDDDDRSVHPGAIEIWYDGLDQDCAGDDDFDQDADGFPLEDDCDDTDPAVSPGAAETWYDGLDQDCAGDDDFDQDVDGFPSDDDCDETDPAFFPGAADPWYDGFDQDCAGDDDFDQDADGFPLDDDCDDTDPSVNPAVPERWYDGFDQDCAGDDDFDQDADGFPFDDDCDDTDPTVNPAVPERWYDGFDQDCAGDDDFDQDADAVALGSDCDDTDGEIAECSYGDADSGDPVVTADDTGVQPPEEDEGCGCRTGSGAGGLAVLLATLLTRRRPAA